MYDTAIYYICTVCATNLNLAYSNLRHGMKTYDDPADVAAKTSAEKTLKTRILITSDI